MTIVTGIQTKEDRTCVSISSHDTGTPEGNHDNGEFHQTLALIIKVAIHNALNYQVKHGNLDKLTVILDGETRELTK
jgi:hypothetical protein